MLLMMKNLPFSYWNLLIILLASMIACSGIGSFSMTEESADIEIPGSNLTIINELSKLFPATIPLTINLDQELEARDAGPAKGVYLTELEFKLVDRSSNKNFDFISDIHIDIESRENASTLGSTELAFIDDVPQNVTEFTLNVNDTLNLKPYIEEGLRLRSHADGTAPPQTAIFRVYATFNVELF